MKETDNIKMEINIGGERLSLVVPFLSQNAVRDTERRVQDLFQSWSARFPDKTPPEILAMVAYRFAYIYGEIEEQTSRALALAEETERKFDRIIRRGQNETASEDTEEPERLSDAARTGDYTNF